MSNFLTYFYGKLHGTIMFYHFLVRLIWYLKTKKASSRTIRRNLYVYKFRFSTL